jgi:hypothetical protein
MGSAVLLGGVHIARRVAIMSGRVCRAQTPQSLAQAWKTAPALLLQVIFRGP